MDYRQPCHNIICVDDILLSSGQYHTMVGQHSAASTRPISTAVEVICMAANANCKALSSAAWLHCWRYAKLFLVSYFAIKSPYAKLSSTTISGRDIRVFSYGIYMYMYEGRL